MTLHMSLPSSLLKDDPNHQKPHRTSQLIFLSLLTVSAQTGEPLLWVVHPEVGHARFHKVRHK